MRKPAADRKRELVETVLTLTRDGGAAALTTNTISQAIGISQPAIFRHFATKQLLWNDVAEHLASQMVTRWQVAVDDEALPLSNAFNLAIAQLTFLQEFPAVLDIVFSRELHHENEELRQKFESLMMQFIGKLEQFFARQLGLPAPSIESRDQALLIAGLVQGIALRWSLGGREFSLPDEGRRLISKHLNAQFPEFIKPLEKTK